MVSLDSYKWTQEAVDYLLNNWSRRTALELAGELPIDANGRRPTRAAVIGKVHRLHLEPKVFTPGPKPKSPRPMHKPAVAKPVVRLRAEPAVLMPVVVPFERPRSKRRRPCSLFELRDDMCRWIRDDGLFCAKEKVPDTSYCLEHFRITRMPVRSVKPRSVSYG